MRILLDTDITLDYIQQRTPFEAEANLVFASLVRREFVGYLAPITINNAFYFARKSGGIANAKIAVEDLLKIVEICSINKSTFENALLLNISDYEDAIQHVCAQNENLDAIVTRNISDYKNATLPVYSPTEFLNLLNTP